MGEIPNVLEHGLWLPTHEEAKNVTKILQIVWKNIQFMYTLFQMQLI